MEAASANFPSRTARELRQSTRRSYSERRTRAPNRGVATPVVRSLSRRLRIHSAVQIAKILKAPSSRHAEPASHRYSAAAEQVCSCTRNRVSLAICSFVFIWNSHSTEKL